MLNAQDHYHIEHYTRHEADTWLLHDVIGIEATLALPSLQCQLALADVYEVEFSLPQPRIARDIPPD